MELDIKAILLAAWDYIVALIKKIFADESGWEVE